MLNVVLSLGLLGTPAIQTDRAIPLRIGSPGKVSLAKKQKQDFTVSLTKGTYRVYLDTKGSDEEGKAANVVQGSVKLMKQNGAQAATLPYDFLGWYEFDALHREVRTLTVAKNTAVRFRVTNSDLSSAEDSLTVVPAAAAFVPFGFGVPVQAARISDQSGVGGRFDFLGYAYYRATLPKGKWSVSLGLRRPEGTDAYLSGTLVLLDPWGKRLPDAPSTIDVTEDTGRVEKVLDVKAPRTIIVRVKNISNNHGALDYDVTIRPATD